LLTAHLFFYLEKAACGPFSDSGFVAGRKKRGFAAC